MSPYRHPSQPSSTKHSCPDRAKHTDRPPGYVAWHEWAERMTKTHNQELCTGCGLWAIWTPKHDNVA